MHWRRKYVRNIVRTLVHKQRCFFVNGWRNTPPPSTDWYNPVAPLQEIAFKHTFVPLQLSCLFSLISLPRLTFGESRPIPCVPFLQDPPPLVLTSQCLTSKETYCLYLSPLASLSCFGPSLLFPLPLASFSCTRTETHNSLAPPPTASEFSWT